MRWNPGHEYACGRPEICLTPEIAQLNAIVEPEFRQGYDRLHDSVPEIEHPKRSIPVLQVFFPYLNRAVRHDWNRLPPKRILVNCEDLIIREKIESEWIEPREVTSEQQRC